MPWIKAILSNKWFWIILGAIILLIILRKYGGSVIQSLKNLISPENIDFAPGEPVILSKQREEEIRAIGDLISADIEDTPVGSRNVAAYEAANALTDNELKFLAKYYKTLDSDEYGLWKAIDSETYYFSAATEANKLKSRLAKIGYKAL